MNPVIDVSQEPWVDETIAIFMEKRRWQQHEETLEQVFDVLERYNKIYSILKNRGYHE
jgi:hypothetical protein